MDGQMDRQMDRGTDRGDCCIPMPFFKKHVGIINN